MTIRFHKNLTLEKWSSLTLDKQLLNIASELIRAKQWMEDNNSSLSKESIERALELMDLTTESQKQKLSGNFLKEFLRLRDCFGEFYCDLNPSKNIEPFLQALVSLNSVTQNLNLVF